MSIANLNIEFLSLESKAFHTRGFILSYSSSHQPRQEWEWSHLESVAFRSACRAHLQAVLHKADRAMQRSESRQTSPYFENQRVGRGGIRWWVWPEAEQTKRTTEALRGPMMTAKLVLCH